MATYRQMGEEQAQPAIGPVCQSPDRLPGTTASNSWGKADRVVVEKSRRMLSLYRGRDLLKAYPVALGRRPCGPKRRAGDLRTPEGRYVLDWRNPDSKFIRSIHISYPNAQDLRIARLRGEDPGGEIMLHGAPGSPAEMARLLSKGADWTAGCIAVHDEALREIWEAVDEGNPIEILP